MESAVLQYRKKIDKLRDARNRLRAKAQSLKNEMREHNQRVADSFEPREIDSHVRGSLMIGWTDL